MEGGGEAEVKAPAEEAPPKEDELYDTLFRWTGGGASVSVIGTWSGWGKRLVIQCLSCRSRA
jgi:hypothetical protein